MKKILSIAALMLAVTFTASAQSEEEESQLFGYTRSMAECKVLNVGSVGKDVIHLEFEVNNDTPKTMKIVGFVLPNGMTAMSMQKQIEDFSKGKIQISIDPSIVEKVNDEVIMLNVLYIDRKGKEEKVQMPYKLASENQR